MLSLLSMHWQAQLSQMQEPLVMELYRIYSCSCKGWQAQRSAYYIRLTLTASTLEQKQHVNANASWTRKAGGSSAMRQQNLSFGLREDLHFCPDPYVLACHVARKPCHRAGVHISRCGQCCACHLNPNLNLCLSRLRCDNWQLPAAT